MGGIELGAFDWLLLAVMTALSIEEAYLVDLARRFSQINRLVMAVGRTLRRRCSDHWKARVMNMCSKWLIVYAVMLPVLIVYALCPLIAAAMLAAGMRWYEVFMRVDVVAFVTVIAVAWYLVFHRLPAAAQRV